jgi:hypothetical protein
MNTFTNAVFISCGQFTHEERLLGQAIVQLVERFTGYKAYFAQNQTTLDGLSANVLRALHTCAGLIAVMHHRGVVETPTGRINRGSVWIEQELAIAAYIQQVLQPEIPVLVFVQKGIALEGIREKLILNPTYFETNSEVLDKLEHTLSYWAASLRPVFQAAEFNPTKRLEGDPLKGEQQYLVLEANELFRVVRLDYIHEGTVTARQLSVPSEEARQLRVPLVHENLKTLTYHETSLKEWPATLALPVVVRDTEISLRYEGVLRRSGEQRILKFEM